MFDAYLVDLLAQKDVLTDWLTDRLTDGHLHFLSCFRSWKLNMKWINFENIISCRTWSRCVNSWVVLMKQTNSIRTCNSFISQHNTTPSHCLQVCLKNRTMVCAVPVKSECVLPRIIQSVANNCTENETGNLHEI